MRPEASWVGVVLCPDPLVRLGTRLRLKIGLVLGKETRQKNYSGNETCSCVLELGDACAVSLMRHLGGEIPLSSGLANRFLYAALVASTPSFYLILVLIGVQ